MKVLQTQQEQQIGLELKLKLITNNKEDEASMMLRSRRCLSWMR